VSQLEHFKTTVGGLALGAVLAGGWHSVTTALLGSTSALPAFGAIALASVLPILIVQKSVRRSARNAERTLLQRLAVLDMHAIVNVVDQNSILTEVNDHLLELTGFSREELIGQPVSHLYDPDDHDITDSILGEIKQGRSWQGETPLRRADGTIFYTQTTVLPLVDEKGNWCGSISARTDVTQHKKLLAERDTALTLHELRDDVWIVDEKSLHFRYMNRTAMARFGWNENEYSEKSLVDLAVEQETGPILDACAALHRTGELIAHHEMSVLGSHFDVTIKLLRNKRSSGRFLILLNDISDRLAQEQLKADFISMVSHELRSPLTSIKGSMGLLLSGAAGDVPSKAKSLLEISHRNADRLVLIINDILDLEKITTGRMEFTMCDVDLDELVKEAIAASAVTTKNFGQRVLFDGVQGGEVIYTDPNRIIQVLTNLISNASKFSRPNGIIHVSCVEGPRGMTLTVRDEGAGIPAEDQHKVFKRFADLSNSDRSGKGGTGLGLSICKAIVESLGGSIGFESHPGSGSSFHFVLPSDKDDREKGNHAAQRRVSG